MINWVGISGKDVFIFRVEVSWVLWLFSSKAPNKGVLEMVCFFNRFVEEVFFFSCLGSRDLSSKHYIAHIIKT